MESGSIMGWLLLGALALLILYAIVIYNALVSLKHGVTKAWSNIDVLLRQRHDELPKLVETCKQYMEFERDTLEKVMQARADAQSARQAGDVKGVGQAETAMRMGLGKLFAVAEAYPELKANESFQQLQTRISGLEDAIADRREFYNESVNANNVRIEQFPDVIIARMFNFREADLLEFSEEEIRDVDVKSLFS
ncbi:MAG: LemA family protein [Salinisphaeraceae bacterium]|nr:LemA family protein [Salinisphaeraceae bacterium]